MLPTIALARPESTRSTRRPESLVDINEPTTTPDRPRRYYRPCTGPRDLRSAIARSCSGRAWRPTAGPRLPATVPVWSSASHWLDALSAAVRTPEGEELRAVAKVRVDTMLDVAAVDARAADSRTGRGVTTAHETVAKALGCSAKTVQRARTLVEALGFARTVAVGRYLTTEERAEATAHHGGDQRRMASERALLVPRSLSNVHLPCGGSISPPLPSRSELPKRADARSGAASRQPAPKKATWRCRPRPTIAVQRLAAEIAARLPWLAHDHIGSLCRTLTVLGLNDTGWGAQDLLDMLDQRNVQHGLYSLASSSQRDPLALFAHQIRAALVDVDEPPRLRRSREAAARAAERARARAEREDEEAHLAAERADPEVQARIAETKRRIRAQLAAARTQARYRHLHADECPRPEEHGLRPSVARPAQI